MTMAMNTTNTIKDINNRMMSTTMPRTMGIAVLLAAMITQQSDAFSMNSLHKSNSNNMMMIPSRSLDSTSKRTSLNLLKFQSESNYDDTIVSSERLTSSSSPYSLSGSTLRQYEGTTDSVTRRSRFRDSIKQSMTRRIRSDSLRMNTSSSSPSRLQMAKNDENNNTEKDNNDDNKPSMLEKVKSSAASILPPKLVELYKVILTKFINFFPTLKVALASFTAGITIALAAILVPVYDSVDKMTEPVTLFETILADLDRGYVEDVDTKKLFETGVSAMLRSLDPYTEFEGKQEAKDLNESVSGKYGGVGLVITGAVPQSQSPGINKNAGGGGGVQKDVSESKLLPKDAVEDSLIMEDSRSSNMIEDDDEDLLNDDIGGIVDEDTLQERMEERRQMKKAREQGVRVVSAFEGYAFDYGMRTGDKILAVDGLRLSPKNTVEDVRGMLRGEPGQDVAITVERVGVDEEITVTIPRKIVQMRDVKLTTMVGKPEDGIGYIQLSGFAANAGREVRSSIFALQQAAEEASNGEQGLQGIILDLRGNPGGLLTSAVDVSSLFVPKGSEIVSARGRGFPGVKYVSRVNPIVDPSTKVAVLINGGTASAAEIVSGAIQDLDVGVIVGSDRTFGKGLVQNVEDLPFDTALKFTVAKYYTPSGRCIQSTNYKEGGGLDAKDGKYVASKIEDKDKTSYFTVNGREVKDGGGIAADYKIDAPKASALEVTLLRSGIMNDFAAEWSKTHQFDEKFSVDAKTYRDFQTYVMQKQKEGDLKLDALYTSPLQSLRRSLKQSGYTAASKEIDVLEASILREMQNDFAKYKEDISEDVGQSILARYLPESMLIERSLKTDEQLIGAVKLLQSNSKQYDKLLGRAVPPEPSPTLASSSSNIADSEKVPVRLNLKW